MSDVSVKGDEMTYPPLAHFPRSIKRQRSLQKGNSGSLLLTVFLQVGHFRLGEGLRAIKSSHDFRDQVVVVGLSNLATVELAELRFQSLRNVVDQHFAINFRRVHRSPALEQKIRFLRSPLQEKIKFPAH